MEVIKIGCGEWGFREIPIEEHFKIAKEFGFKTLEFGIGGGQTGRLDETIAEKEIGRFKDLASDYDIRTPYCCIENDFTLPDALAHQEMLRYVRALLPKAKDCGATHIRLFAGFTLYEEMNEAIWKRLNEAFHLCVSDCRKLGLLISIETHGNILWENGVAIHRHTVSTKIEGVQRLLEDLPTEVGFNFDPGNLKAVASQDNTFLLPYINSRINYCHLKDWKAERGGWVACAIGDSDLEYKSLLDQLSYDGIYLIEYEPTKDVIDGINRSLDYLKRIGFTPEYT